jgi:hypothetical protein
MAYLRDIAEIKQNIPISIKMLVRVFDFPGKLLKSALEHGVKPPGNRGKHAALDQDHEKQIFDSIRQNSERSTPVTKKEIKHYCTSHLQAPIIRSWVNSFLFQGPEGIIQTKNVRQEEQYLHVPRD